MKCRSPQEKAHRTGLLRPCDISADKAGQEATDTSTPFPVAAFGVSGEEANDNSPGRPHPFGDNALPLRRRGLQVVPCGKGDEGKGALIQGWTTRRLSAAEVKELAGRPNFATANIGVVCGLSGLVVVDVDRPDLIEAMVLRFGETPLIVRTPSGGVHLYYNTLHPVKSTKLQAEGLKVDIQADLKMVIVPPSFNRQSGDPYVFEQGSWDDLPRLPLFNVAALAKPATRTISLPSFDPYERDASRDVPEGMRDDTVFIYAMRKAPHVGSEDELIAEMLRFNAQHCSPPLPARQAEEKARSAWGYEQRGENLIGHGGGGVVLNNAVVDDLLGRVHGPDALALLSKLKRSHGARKTSFAVSCGGMARKGVIAGWKTPRRYARARKILEARGYLVQVVPPGREPGGRHTPAQYRLGSGMQITHPI